MATVRQIAADAGVSVGTVSRVLNNSASVSAASRQKVLRVVEMTKYVNPVVTRRTLKTVALVATGGPSPLGGPYDLALVQGIHEGLAGHDYNLMLLDLQRNHERGETYGQTLSRLNIGGALLRTTAATSRVVEEIADGPVPAVVIADTAASGRVPSVTCSSDHATQQAISHLAGLGHKRIAVTLNVVMDFDHMQRFEQWKAGMITCGLEPASDLIMKVPAQRDAGATALRQILAMKDRPTAVFAADPHTAAGILQEALRLNVDIPGELSVVGFDDTDLRLGVYPRLSAICQDAVRLGRDAFALLEQLMHADEGSTIPIVDHRLECWFEPHHSTAPPHQTSD